MTDPYRILGITRDASDEEIKKAYRKLSRQYHPDANINNPNKAQAEEKFKEVQLAYEQIMKEKEYGSSAEQGWYSDYGRQQSRYQDEESVRRQAAANFIQSAHYREAMNVLSGLQQRNGQWYYLSALAHAGLGNNVNALECIRTAVELEPDNFQYKMLLNRMEGGGTWYQERQNPFGGMPVAGDDLCMKLCIANLACNCCCPGRVFCC